MRDKEEVLARSEDIYGSPEYWMTVLPGADVVPYLAGFAASVYSEKCAELEYREIAQGLKNFAFDHIRFLSELSETEEGRKLKALLELEYEMDFTCIRRCYENEEGRRSKNQFEGSLNFEPIFSTVSGEFVASQLQIKFGDLGDLGCNLTVFGKSISKVMSGKNMAESIHFLFAGASFVTDWISNSCVSFNRMVELLGPGKMTSDEWKYFILGTATVPLELFAAFMIRSSWKSIKSGKLIPAGLSLVLGLGLVTLTLPSLVNTYSFVRSAIPPYWVANSIDILGLAKTDSIFKAGLFFATFFVNYYSELYTIIAEKSLENN